MGRSLKAVNCSWSTGNECSSTAHFHCKIVFRIVRIRSPVLDQVLYHERIRDASPVIVACTKVYSHRLFNQELESLTVYHKFARRRAANFLTKV